MLFQGNCYCRWNGIVKQEKEWHPELGMEPGLWFRCLITVYLCISIKSVLILTTLTHELLASPLYLSPSLPPSHSPFLPSSFIPPLPPFFTLSPLLSRSSFTLLYTMISMCVHEYVGIHWRVMGLINLPL